MLLYYGLQEHFSAQLGSWGAINMKTSKLWLYLFKVLLKQYLDGATSLPYRSMQTETFFFLTFIFILTFFWKTRWGTAKQCQELHRTRSLLTLTPSPAQREFQHPNDDFNWYSPGKIKLGGHNTKTGLCFTSQPPNFTCNYKAEYKGAALKRKETNGFNV